MLWIHLIFLVFFVYVIFFLPAFSSLIKSLTIKADRSSGTLQHFTIKRNPFLTRTQLEVCFFEGNLSDDLIKGDENVSGSFQNMIYLPLSKFYFLVLETFPWKRPGRKTFPYCALKCGTDLNSHWVKESMCSHRWLLKNESCLSIWENRKKRTRSLELHDLAR